MRVSGQRYDALRQRLEKKKLPAPPFSKEEFRADMLEVMGGKYDGAFECRYCHGRFTIEEIVGDHAVPLARGGGVELSNMDYPCGPCNDRKGSLTLAEYTKLLEFLDHPFMRFARKDILSRLQKANALAAGMRRMIVQQKAAKEGVAPPARREKSAPLLDDPNNGLGDL